MTVVPTKRDWAKLDADRSKVLAVVGAERVGALAHGDRESVKLLRGDTVALEPVRWLWPGFVPSGMLTILGGSPGCGKTTIALSIAAELTRGTKAGGKWPDGSRVGDAGDVLIWSGEDAAPVLAARLRAAGADMARVHFVDSLGTGDPFDPGRDMVLLEAEADKLKAPRLLILDPIVSAVTGDSHKGAEVRRSLAPVVTLAQRLGCAVLGITHFSKGTGGRDPVERVTGSIAFAALARLVLVAAKVKSDDDDGERRLLLRAKSNIGPDDGGFAYDLERVEVAPDVEGQRVRWLEPLQGTARDLLAEAETDVDDGETSAFEDACSFLSSELAGEPKPAKYLFAEARNAGHSERTLKRAKAHLGAESRKEAAGWVWGLPAAVKDAKGAKRAKLHSEGPHGTVATVASNKATNPTSGRLGTVGTLGTLEDDAEII
jgi:putative DNA primase/helicase